MTDWTIAFQPLMPIWLLAAFAVAGAVFLAAGLMMRTRGSALRALAAFSVLLALANPIFLDEDRQGLRDVAVVVVDESASQKTGRRPEQTVAAHAAVMRQLEAPRRRASASATGCGVLLVSGEPHAGERTWRNLLKSDASVDLVHFTILRPPEKQDGTPINELSLIAFPTRELFSRRSTSST
jgi:hypothetical protein